MHGEAESKAHAGVTELEMLLARARANNAAIVRVLAAVTEARTSTEAAKIALDAVRREFGWAYGSYWTVDQGEHVLRFATDSGEVGDAFRRVTMESTFARGVGFNGRTWDRGDLVFVRDIGALLDCVRAPVAREMGVKSGVCFPIEVRGEIVGTMDYFVLEELELDEERIEALRNVARLVSIALSRVEATERERANAIAFRTAMSMLSAKLSSASKELSAMTSAQALASQNQAVAIAQLSATMSELRHTALQSMDKAQSLIDVSDRALSRAEEGSVAVDGVLHGMSDIREKVQVIGTKIKSLNEQTQQIGEIIASVGEIADQSRLLALNAAMEAARAGEHGRGFSVVASEIRNLANQSKESTAQVRKILGDIKHATEAAVVAMEAGTKKVEAGVLLASRAGERIEALNRFVGDALEAARLIAGTAQHQGTGVSQAAEAIGGINRDTASVVEVVRRAEGMAEDLTRTVQDISILVERFGAAEQG